MPPRRKRPSLTNYAIAESTHLLREMTGRKHALLAGRGAAGIWAALRALGLHDDDVLIPANTCYIVLWAVLKSGNRPLLVDVDAATGNLTVQKLIHHRHTNGAKKKPKAIIPCHIYGLPAPMAAICDWAKANEIYVIEDAALALGATVEGKPAGAWGAVSILSFGLGKIVDNQVGGAVLTDDDRLAADIEKLLADLPLWDDRLMSLTNQWNAIYWALHQYEAENPRLTALYPTLYGLYGDLTAYRLPASGWNDLPGLLRDLPAYVAHRAALAAVYDGLFNPLSVSVAASSKSPVCTLGRPEGSIVWRYPLLVAADQRADLLQYLWNNGVPDATRWYPPLRYMTTALLPDVPQPPTPDADRMGASIINLRLDRGVNQNDVEHIANLIHAYYD